MGCFWGAERSLLAGARRLYDRRRLRGRVHAEPDLRGGLLGCTGHTEAVLVVFDPHRHQLRAAAALFWEGHDPTQGMRQGNDVGTQYRSAIYWQGEHQTRRRRPRGRPTSRC
jgi:peptide-methionine (S)-S-oxide reductase